MKKIKKFNIRADLWYDTEEGFWLDVSGQTARIGMSPLVQETTGSFVSIRIKESGTSLAKGESFGSVEAEKHVGHLKTPLSGNIVEVNEKVLENPRLLNTDPYGKAWLIAIELTQVEEEQAALIKDEEDIIAWFESEIAKYEDKGWIAEL